MPRPRPRQAASARLMALLLVVALGAPRGAGFTAPLALYGARDLAGRPPATRPPDLARFFGAHYAAIELGEAQRFTVQLDTGSSALVVPSASCGGCGDDELRRYRPDPSSDKSVRCDDERCSGHCQPGVCTNAKGAVCDARAAPPPWALDLLLQGRNASQTSACVDDPMWRGTDGLGCAKFAAAPSDWCGEGESVARCPKSCGGCGRCCSATAGPNGGCFFEQSYADGTYGTGALHMDRMAVVGGAGSSHSSHSSSAAAASVIFGLVESATGTADAPFSPEGIDGVFGIGYSWLNCHPTCTPAPLDALLAAIAKPHTNSMNAISDTGTTATVLSADNIFALCLATPSAAADHISRHQIGTYDDDTPADHDAYMGAGGSWDIGWADHTKHHGTLHWLKILHESYYIVHPPLATRYLKLSISGGTASSNMIQGLRSSSWGLTVLDSGTPHVLVPPAVFNALKPALLSQVSTNACPSLLKIFDEMCIPAAPLLPQVLLDKHWKDRKTPKAAAVAQLSHHLLVNFPTLEFVFRSSDGKPFRVQWGPEYYLYASPINPFASLLMTKHTNMTGPDGGRDRAATAGGEDEDVHGWVCSGIIGAGDRTVLGAAFMRAFYTVFDRGEKIIGLAPSVNCTITTASSSTKRHGGKYGGKRGGEVVATLSGEQRLERWDSVELGGPTLPTPPLWLLLAFAGIGILCTRRRQCWQMRRKVSRCGSICCKVMGEVCCDVCCECHQTMMMKDTTRGGTVETQLQVKV